MERLLSSVVPESTPGIPYAAFGKDNEAVLSSIKAQIVGVVIARLQRLCGVSTLGGDPVAFVISGLTDVVRLFVKQEPHKWQKILDGRFRLIANVSLADQLVERVLYQASSKEEIANWETIPSKPGMGATDESLVILARNLGDLLSKGGLLDTDVSAWDWQRKWWLGFVTVYTQCVQCGLKGKYANACFAREFVSMAPVFATSDGMLWTTWVFGLMLSGRFPTSMFNSKGRTCLAEMVGTRNIAMGDDCQEGVLDQADADSVLEAYSDFGWKGLIESTVSSSLEGAVFCSLRFYRSHAWLAEPVNWRRTLFRLLCKKHVPRSELLQFEWEVRHLRVGPSLELVRAWAADKH